MLVAIRVAATLKTVYVERVIDARLSRAACERADRGSSWVLEQVLKMPNAAVEEPSFAECIPYTSILADLAPYQAG